MFFKGLFISVIAILISCTPVVEKMDYFDIFEIPSTPTLLKDDEFHVGIDVYYYPNYKYYNTTIYYAKTLEKYSTWEKVHEEQTSIHYMNLQFRLVQSSGTIEHAGFTHYNPILITMKGNEMGLIRSLDNNNVFYFASDSLETLDLYYVQGTNNEFDHQTITKLPISTDSTNEANLNQTMISGAKSYIFCSDRENSIYNIYSTPSLESTKITKEKILSSSKNDIDPYIHDSIMVFSSNRDGGYGGYDLYHSTFSDGKWTTPVNFGPKINTMYNELDPQLITMDYNLFFNDMMIFSSDDPENLRSDNVTALYYVGVKKGL